MEMETRQRALLLLDRVRQRQPAKATDSHRADEEAAEDFEQLQLRNNNLSGAAVQGLPLDYARIREEAAEVRKRASRLKVHFWLTEPDKSQKQNKGGEILTPEGLTLDVASLDALVKSFVWNPLFQQPDVVDMEQRMKARRDLEGIISLSARIRGCAEALGKGVGEKF